MESLDTKALEDSLNDVTGKGTEKKAEEQPAQKMSPEEEKGFHKGAVNTLVAERSELIKMVANVEAILQAHLTRLKELGVDIGANPEEAKKE